MDSATDGADIPAARRGLRHKCRFNSEARIIGGNHACQRVIRSRDGIHGHLVSSPPGTEILPDNPDDELNSVPERRTVMTISWIEYKGRKILKTVYTGHTHQENVKLLEEQGEFERRDPNLLILSDYRGTHASQEYMEKVKAYGKEFRGGPTQVKNAVIGIDGLKRVLLDGYLRFTGDKNTKSFNSEEEALEWLVK